jgi:hypothetical protein
MRFFGWEALESPLDEGRGPKRTGARHAMCMGIIITSSHDRGDGYFGKKKTPVAGVRWHTGTAFLVLRTALGDVLWIS